MPPLIPMTVGNLVCIVLTLVYGTCFIKFGVRKTLIPCIAVSALGCLYLAAANGLACNSPNATLASAAIGDPNVVGNYMLYAISPVPDPRHLHVLPDGLASSWPLPGSFAIAAVCWALSPWVPPCSPWWAPL